MKTSILSRLALLLILGLSAATHVNAQASINGKIDEVMLDDSYIVIDGKRMVVRAAALVITYKGEPVRASFLSEGQSVMYKTADDGSVSEITLIGPSSELDQLDKH